GPLVGCAARIATDLALGGRLDLAALLVELIDAAPPAAGDANVRGLVLGAHAALALRRGDPEACHRHSRAAAACFAEVGNARMASGQPAGAAAACLPGGVSAEAEAPLREALAGAERLGLAGVVASARHDLGHALHRLGRHTEAIELLRRAVDALAA